MPFAAFGVVSVVGRGMGVLDAGGDRRREGAVFGGGKFGASHCNNGNGDAIFPDYFGEDLLQTVCCTSMNTLMSGRCPLS